tara:strand:- start:9191 stop:10531 length:1341 start_codon:yes stop_codon:yes gene_type:complete
MINSRKLRSLYESKGKSAAGALSFVNEVHNLLGLCDENGNKYRDAAGNPIIKEAKVRAEDFNLHEVAQAVLGENWAEIVEGRTQSSFAALTKRAEMERSGSASKDIFESGVGVGVDPSAGININAFSGLTSGLIERRILESFQNPMFIANELMPDEAFKASGQKYIQSSPLGDRAARRNAGEPHARANTYGRFVRLPESYENALAIDVTAEAIFYSLDNSLMSVASSVGTELAYRKELENLNTIVNATTNFKWNDVAYDTYADYSASLGYNNLIGSNALLDWTSIQTDVVAFSRFTDPDTKKRILVQPTVLLVPPALLETAKLIVGATGGERRTDKGLTQANATSLNVANTDYFPYGGQFKVVSSPLLEQVLVDSGTATDNADASKFWFMIDPSKAFRFISNMPLTVSQSTGSYQQLDNKIAISYFASYRGTPAVISPWHAIRNKG